MGRQGYGRAGNEYLRQDHSDWCVRSLGIGTRYGKGGGGNGGNVTNIDTTTDEVSVIFLISVVCLLLSIISNFCILS